MMESSVRSLSSNPNRPCFFLQYGETFIMLDCAMDWRPCLKFLPVTQVFTAPLAQIKTWDHGNSFLYTTDNDILENEGHLMINGAPEFEIPNFQHVEPADLHYIIISNFSQIFALPYLINERNFNGKIFATAPTIQLAKDVFQDMSDYLTAYSTSIKAEKWKAKEVIQFLPPVLQCPRLHLWKSLCSMEAFEAALKRVEVVNYRQTIPLENSLIITAYSSGFAMGSCNWTIQSPEEKIGYFADSSTLNTHLSPLDLEDMKNPDVMIMAALSMDPTRSVSDSLERLAKTVLDTVKDGGNVLIPFSRVDLLIDLLEYFYLYVDGLPSTIPINVISGTARSMLSLSQVFAEWLNKDYRDKAYLPEEPFIHGEMIRNSRLNIFPSVDGKFSEQFRSPCIVFCSHYSLRFGPGVHLMSQFKTSPKNGIIFTDPEFNFEEVLAPFRPFAIKVSYCPMDTRLNPAQASKVIATCDPKSIVIHERYLTPYDSSPEAAEHTVRCHPSVKVLAYRENVDVPLAPRYRWLETVGDAGFLSTIPMTDILQPKTDATTDTGEANKVLIGRIYGNLKAVDNQYEIQPPIGPKKTTIEEPVPAVYPKLCFRKPDPWKLLRYLKREGFTDVILVEEEGSKEDAKLAVKLMSVEYRFTVTITDSATDVSTLRPSVETRKRLKKVMELIRLKEPTVTGVQREDGSVLEVLPVPEGIVS